MAATYDDLLKLPDFLVAEIVDGELYASPFQGTRHANATGGVLAQLHEGTEWWFLYRTELHLGGDVLVPDIAGWRRERMPRIPDVEYLELVPDWICEVVAPKKATLARFRKMPRYAMHGVEYAWIVDPFAKAVEVYERVAADWYESAMYQGSGVIRAVPFEAGEINLAHLWIA